MAIRMNWAAYFDASKELGLALGDSYVDLISMDAPEYFPAGSCIAIEEGEDYSDWKHCPSAHAIRS